MSAARMVVVGYGSWPDSLETFLVRAALRLGYDARELRLHAARTMLSPKVPGRLRRLMWRPQLAGLVGTLAHLSSRPDDILVLVKCTPLLIDTEQLSRVLDSWRGRILLVAPDRLSTFCSREALQILVERGVAICTFDAEAELAEYGALLDSCLIEYRFGYDTEAHWRPLDSTSQTLEEIVFVGTWDVERERVIATLGRHYTVAVYGTFWNRSRQHSGVRIVSASGLFGQEQAAVITRFAAALNIPRTQNLRTGNMRTFEVPAQGGLQANAYGAQILNNGIWARDTEELMRRIDTWLTAPRPKRLAVLRAAQAEVMPYAYEMRLRKLLDTLAANLA